MQFADPHLPFWLLALPAVAVAGWFAAVARARTLRRFAGGAAHVERFVVQVSVHRRALGFLLILGCAGASILALARPQWGSRLEPIRREGVDVMIVLDTSLSMAAEDVAPSRLAQARNEIDRLIHRLAGNRVGLVTFAGEATLTCPLTPDHEAVRLFLDALSTESVLVPGTALASSLDLASRAFSTNGTSREEAGRAIVLFTDGEDHAGGVDEAVPTLEREDIVVHVVGVGTPRGAPIPLRDAAGALTGYKKDREGWLVTTRLGEEALAAIALESGGNYFRATPTESEVDEIAQRLVGMEAGEFTGALRPRYEDRFQVPLALGLLALLAETLLGDRRGSRRRLEAS